MLSSRNQRARKQPIRKKPASPSLTSLFSSMTGFSTGSSGSNSTVTQESVSRGRHRTSKHGTKKTTSPQSGDGGENSLPASPVEEERPNVFAYMEDDPEEGDGTQGTDHVEMEEVDRDEHSDVQQIFHPLSPPATPEDIPAKPLQTISEATQRLWRDRRPPSGSFYSDSGISMRSSSPERDPSATKRKTGTKAVASRSRQMTRDNSSSSATSRKSKGKVTTDFQGPPEAFYQRAARSALRLPGLAPRAPAPPDQALQTVPARTLARRVPRRGNDKTGYALLASTLSTTDDDESLLPIYRRFEALNNRVLLSLQDEITTMENDLSVLDRTIAEMDGSTRRPASRRSELRAPTQLQWQRMDLVCAAGCEVGSVQ